MNPTSTHGAQMASLLGKQTTPPDLVERPKTRPRVTRAGRRGAAAAAEVQPYMVETIRAAKRTEEPIR